MNLLSRATQSEGWGLSSDPLYMFDGGTSMATPLVAGCIANVRAYLRTTHKLKAPSAALLKAMVINGAHDLAGQYTASEAGVIPNNSEGFGRLDLQAVIGPYGVGETVTFFDEGKALDTGEAANQSVTVPAGGKLLKATLVWTDPPGEGLQSDLDLIVTAAGQERPAVALASMRSSATPSLPIAAWKIVPPTPGRLDADGSGGNVR